MSGSPGNETNLPNKPMVSICYLGFEGIHVIISGHGMSKLLKQVGPSADMGDGGSFIANSRSPGTLEKGKVGKGNTSTTYLANGLPFKLLGIPYLFGENKVQTFFSGSIG